MNVSKHDQKLILILLGLVVFLTAYFGICKTFNAKKADVESQIVSLSSRVDELNGYYENQTSYQSEIDRVDSEISAELAKYPSEVRSEDMIMYATELEDQIGIKIDSISITPPEAIIKLMVPQKADTSFLLNPVIAMRTGLTINCNLGYEQLKKLLNYVYASSEKTDVSNVTVNFSPETGKLDAIITMEKYFIASTEYTYTPTEIPSVPKGTTDPFGTITDAAVSPTSSNTPNAG